MEFTHHGANEPFDVPTVVRSLGRTVGQRDAVLPATSLEGVAVELLRVVEVDRLGQASDRP
jgi:hypothetical protein